MLLGTEQVPAQLPAPPPSGKRVSFSGCLPQPEPAVNASRPISARHVSRRLLFPAHQDAPVMSVDPDTAQREACFSQRAGLLSGKSSRKLLATNQTSQAQQPTVEDPRQNKTNFRAMLAGRSSRKLLQTAADRTENPEAGDPTISTEGAGLQSTLSGSQIDVRAMLAGRSHQRAPTAGSSTEGAAPDDVSISAATGYRGFLSGKSSRKLLSAPAVAEMVSEAAVQELESSVPASKQTVSCRGMLVGKSSRKLLSAAAAADDDGDEDEDEDDSDSIAAVAAAVPATNATAGLRGMLASRSSGKLLAPAATIADQIAPASAPSGVPQIPPAAGKAQLPSSAGFRARLATRSSRRLLMLSSIKEDPSTPTPGASEANSPAGSSKPPGGLRTMLAGKSSRKLLLKETSLMSTAAAECLQKGDGEDISAAVAAFGQMQGTNSTTAANSSLRAKLVGVSSRKLLCKTSPDFTPLSDDGSGAVATNSSSSNSSSSNIVSGGKARAMLAGRSSRKLLSRAGTEAEAANNSESVTACSSSNSSATVGSTRDLLRGKSSRKLLCRTAEATQDPDRAAVTATGINPAVEAGAITTAQRSCSSIAAESQNAPAGLNMHLSSTTATAQAPGSLPSVDSTGISKRRQLAGMSSRKLLSAAAVPQINATEVHHSSPDNQAADAEGNMQHLVSRGGGSGSFKLASKSAESTEVPALGGCTVLSKQHVDGLAHVLSNTTQKVVLLSALAELQDLAACGTSNQLLISQNQFVVDSLGDLLYDAAVDLQCAAAALVHGLASGVPENQAALGSSTAGCNIISGLITLLGGCSGAAKTHAAVALWVLAAGDSEVQGRIVTAGGVAMVEDLTRMMTGPAAACYAVGLIWTLVSDNREHQALFAGVSHPLQRVGGVMSCLLMLIEVGSKEEKEYAAGALQGLVFGHAEVVRLARKLGVRERVQVLLREERRDLSCWVAHASADAAESLQRVVEALQVGW